MKSPDMSRGARLAAHGAVSTSLALCSDRRLHELVDAATPIGSGVGGKTVLLEVDGIPVFVKQLRLTDLERRPENVHSTANLFGVPSFCQYGIGTVCGPQFGAWRELAVHTMTTNWVIAGAYEGFPLTYHRAAGVGTGDDAERFPGPWRCGGEVAGQDGAGDVGRVGGGGGTAVALADPYAAARLVQLHFPGETGRGVFAGHALIFAGPGGFGCGYWPDTSSAELAASTFG